jgi:predicted NBD/HSP70 family sugar kinase
MMVLGVDCGGTNIKIALVKESGEMEQSALEPINFKRPVDQVVSDIASRIKSFKRRHSASQAQKVGWVSLGTLIQRKALCAFLPISGGKMFRSRDCWIAI